MKIECFFSIIIATYNADDYLTRLLRSIEEQTTRNIQVIIIDGGSKDQTIEIIKQYSHIVSYWKSEPDNGIYDAWNKGVSKATGDWIMFLGSDDMLLPDALSRYVNFIENLENKRELELVSSRVQMIDRNGKPIRIKGWPFQWPLFLKEVTIAHPGALHSRRLFEKYGKYDTTYKIVGDFEFLLRPGPNLKTAFLNEVTVIMSEDGTSDSIAAIKEHYKAVTSTGRYARHKALFNFLIVVLKFKARKVARRFNLNLYLRQA